MVSAKLDRHVPVTQVIGRARQVKCRAVFAAVRDDQHRLRRRNHLDERAVFSDQHVAATHQRATRQEHADLAALRVGGVEAALLANVPVEFNT